MTQGREESSWRPNQKRGAPILRTGRAGLTIRPHDGSWVENSGSKSSVLRQQQCGSRFPVLPSGLSIAQKAQKSAHSCPVNPVQAQGAPGNQRALAYLFLNRKMLNHKSENRLGAESEHGS